MVSDEGRGIQLLAGGGVTDPSRFNIYDESMLLESGWLFSYAVGI